jgi:dimethylhistidine N-methyltransferase
MASLCSAGSQAMSVPDERPVESRAALSSRVRWIDRLSGVAERDFAASVRAGLLARPKHLSCAWFYDVDGSRLFEEICALPEYYLTRAEHEILVARAAEIAADCPPGAQLVELGSGSAAKTRLLIAELVARNRSLRYVPIDISRAALADCARALTSECARLEVLAIAAEYEAGLAELRATAPGAKLVLWLGSNVGNFHRDDAARFLARLRAVLDAGDRLLIGIDLRKDRATLERAYDDAAGVTARFNLNLLERINRELGGHFALELFAHRARYDEALGRVEMYLDSRVAQRVAVDALGLELDFAAGEPIHTENSYKYSPREIEALAAGGGWRIESSWTDAAQRFCLARCAPLEDGGTERGASRLRG